MIKIIAGAAAVWGMGIPIVLAIKSGDARLLLLAPLGLLLVPVAVVLSMFGRVLLWLQLVLFWYIRGAIAAISLLLFAGLSCAVLILPNQWIDQSAGRIADLLPSNALALGAIAAIVAIAAIAFYAMARRSGCQKTDQRKPINKTAAAPAPSSSSGSPSSGRGRPLTYLQHRHNKDT
jgi:hypothetical protein